MKEKKSRHTPGPWVLDGHTIYGPKDDRSRHPNGRILIATVTRSGNERINPHTLGGYFSSDFDSFLDASLIAAAPEMLEALIDIVSSIRAIDSHHPDLDIPGYLSREIEACEAVIKKARGME